MNKELMFSSKKDDWETPIDLFNTLNEEFHFTVDLCASDKNHLCEKYYTKDHSGLDADLTGEVVFCNPPYGRGKILQWVRKCALAKATVVMLIPARTDTKAFHEYIYNKAEIRFLRGRLKFGGSDTKNPAPFHSMIVVFRSS